MGRACPGHTTALGCEIMCRRTLAHAFVRQDLTLNRTQISGDKMLNSNQPHVEDDEGPIWETIKLTPYDRRLKELRELQGKRDAIAASGDLSDYDQRRLLVLAWQIGKAQKRFDLEGERARDDDWRTRRNIDGWRAGIGREEYNSSRRKVRILPNTDLSEMAPDQKAQYERDRRSDANWLKRCRDRGMTEPEIAAAYRARITERTQNRGAVPTGLEQAEADDNGLRSLPGFGMF